MHYEGVYIGYREYILKLGGRTPMVHLPIPTRTPSFAKAPPKWPNRLKWWMWEKLGPKPYEYRVFSGLANDDYPDEWTSIDFNTRVMYGIVKENNAMLKFQYRQSFEPQERQFYLGFILLECVSGFKIKNAVPGLPAKYEIAFLR